jgi:hypothetical protein
MRRKRKAAGRSCVWVGYGREKEKRKSSYVWVMGKKAVVVWVDYGREKRG